jgi:hypothetical protein
LLAAYSPTQAAATPALTWNMFWPICDALAAIIRPDIAPEASNASSR